jgi:hypothetical protein
MFPKQISFFLLALFLLSAVPALGDGDAADIPPLSPLPDSTLISAAGYDPATQTLAIVFRHSIDVFLYDGVPQEVYDGFLAAESHGKCFVHSIKPVFSGRAVPGGATNAPWSTPDEAAPAP